MEQEKVANPKLTNFLEVWPPSPSFWNNCWGMLGKAGLAEQRTGSVLVVEKPIGHDLTPAVALNKTLLVTSEESQIYRID